MLSESDTPSSDERRARIVAELVDALERGESDALPRACREHPDLTRDLRDAAETMASLRSLPGGPNDRCARVGPGSRIAHFRILEEIGRGGMGIVFRARDEHLGREVALKWLASPLLSKGRIEAEASALAKIRHPNIVPIYEIVEGEAGLPAFAMELVDGESLEKIVARAIASGCPQHEGFALLPLGSDTPATPASYERSAASLIAKVADALEHAHQKQLIHRDVKPANILVDRRGEPHLIDFGLVRDLELASSARAGRGPGTAQYMAPEQIDGRGTPIDARTDVFSLGVTLYETLALRRAFSGKRRARSITRFSSAIPGAPPAAPRGRARPRDHLRESHGEGARASLRERRRAPRRSHRVPRGSPDRGAPGRRRRADREMGEA